MIRHVNNLWPSLDRNKWMQLAKYFKWCQLVLVDEGEHLILKIMAVLTIWAQNLINV